MLNLRLPLTLTLLAGVAIGQCTITSTGTGLAAAPIDGWSASIPLGFTFPFNGTTYTHMYVTDHGVVALANGTVPAVPAGGVQVYDPGSQPNTTGLTGGFPLNGGGFAGFNADVICAYWGDHTVNNGNIFVHNTSGSYCTVTWLNNEPYFNYGPGQFTAQVTMHNDGRVVVCLDSRCNNTSSTFDPVTTVIGIAVNGVAIPAESDFSSGAVVATVPTVFEEFTGPGPIGSNSPDPNFDLGNTTIEFLPATPGWIVLTSPLTCGSSTTVGTGCSGLSLASSSPTIGQPWVLDVTGINAPAPLPNWIGFGAGIPAAPIGLLLPGTFGPTCNGYMDLSLGLVDIGVATGGAAQLQLQLPASAFLKGAAVSCQAVSFDLSGAGIFAVSNGIDGVIGY